MRDSINYGQLMQHALRGLMAQILRDVAEGGLPGKHHFFITFETDHPDVVLPDWLKDKYPEEMTVVMQEWFDDLVVADDRFSITLNFGNDEVRMTIPFDSISTFVDPSVKFGLKFEATDIDDDESPMIEIDEEEDDDAPQGDAEVVSLDAFRK